MMSTKQDSNESGASSHQQKEMDQYQRKEEVDSRTEGVALPPNLMKAIRRRSSSVLGSTSSNGGGSSGNNSDNSGIVSIGNNSFGFNFDSEEGMNNSGSNSDGDGKASGEGKAGAMNTDSAHGSETSEDGKKLKAMSIITSSSEGDASKKNSESSSGSDWKSSVSSLTQPSGLDTSSNTSDKNESHHAVAAAVVANLHSIASKHSATDKSNDVDEKLPAKKPDAQPSMTNKSLPPFTRKRAAPMADDQDTGGYNSEADGEHAVSCTTAAASKDSAGAASSVAVTRSRRTSPTRTSSQTNTESVATDAATVPRGRARKKTKKVDDNKREERNAREKERSYRISKQINELRNLLSSGGVIVPKGTKSSVLTEAANYIRMLQQHQYRSEIDRHQLVQQMQMIGGGAVGPQASNAIRHVAAQNGVWSLGNFGGVPPKSAMTPYQGVKEASPDEVTSQAAEADEPISATIQEHDYRFIFNSSPVGMAIASMGGAFIDCNSLFCQLSNYTKQEVCSMTIFNLTSRQDLQHAFDLISQMISPPAEEGAANLKPASCVLRGSMKNRDDLGLSVRLIRGEDGIAKCFCVTVIKNPSSPFDTSRPTPATADLIMPSMPTAKNAISSAPAYTTG